MMSQLSLVSFLCGLVMTTAINKVSGIHEYEELIHNVIGGFDSSQSTDDNFYAIQAILCPESVFCPESLNKHSDLTTFLRREDGEAYNVIFNSNNDTVLDHRATLITQARQIHGCCKACSCKPSCAERNNCCPELLFDKTGGFGEEEADTSIKQICSTSSIRRYKNTKISTLNEFYGYSFYMVVDCFNPDVNDTDTVIKCCRPDVKDPSQMIPVYSSNTDRTYRNVYCAQCNGDDNVTPWSVRVVMASVFSAGVQDPGFPSDPSDIYRFIENSLRMNDILFYPPENIEVRPEEPMCVVSEDVEDAIKQCNGRISDQKDVKDFITQSCSKFSSVYKDMRQSYGNVLCFLCNNRQLTNNEKMTCTVNQFEKRFFKEITALIRFDNDVATLDQTDRHRRTNSCECTSMVDQDQVRYQ